MLDKQLDTNRHVKKRHRLTQVPRDTLDILVYTHMHTSIHTVGPSEALFQEKMSTKLWLS